jgi:CheY-like chemotaxis protein/thiamine kinase-like enzyme
MKIKRKVLVVEDKDVWMEPVKEALINGGFEVKSAASYPDAEDLLKNEFFHIALVDLELGEPEGNTYGVEVLEYIKEYYPDCHCLIYTQHAFDREYTETVINCLSVPNIIARGCYMKNVRYDLDDVKSEFFEPTWDNFIKINHEIEIIPEGFDLDGMLIEQFGKKNLKMVKESLLSIIGKLFYGDNEIEKVILNPFKQGYSKSILFKASVKSNLLKERPGKQVIIKFGEKKIIKQESINYDKCVQWFLTLNQSVQKLSYKELNDYAAILYTFAGDSPKNILTFAEGIKEKDENKDEIIRRSISNMFNPERRDWYHPDVIEKERSIRKYYLESVLHKTPADLTKIFIDEILKSKNANIEFKDKDKSLYFDNIKIPDPYLFSNSQPFMEDFSTCIIHGDLNTNNIIIDSKGKWYLIDYAHTGRGHVFLDFINLELNIRHNLFWENGILFTLKEMHNFEKSIIDKFGVDEGNMPSADMENKKYYLEKAKHLILLIRRMASDNFKDEPKRLYNLGLFYMALEMTTKRMEGGVNEKKHFIMLAGLLTKYLDKK